MHLTGSGTCFRQTGVVMTNPDGWWSLYTPHYNEGPTTTGYMYIARGGDPSVNVMAFAPDGYVGVGTSAPQNKLHVKVGSGTNCLSVENGSSTSWLNLYEGGDGPAIIWNSGGTNNVLRFGTWTEITESTPSTWSEKMRITSDGKVGIGTDSPTEKLDVNGAIRIRGSDLSEKFDVSPAGTQPKPGHVVCIDPGNPGKLIVSTKAYDRTVAGVISGAGGITTGITMGQPDTLADGAQRVALTGRVYAYADASNGTIEPGDLLTTSDTPGHVMKVADFDKAHGAVIGKAMTRLEAERGLVLVLVSLQ